MLIRTAAGIAVLAFEAGMALVLEQETCKALANKNKICVVTVGPPTAGN